MTNTHVEYYSFCDGTSTKNKKQKKRNEKLSCLRSAIDPTLQDHVVSIVM